MMNLIQFYLLSIIYLVLLFIPEVVMELNSHYDLPKVRIRFKTESSKEASVGVSTIPYFKEYDPTPSVFLERIKNGKEIHDAFMRYRKLKKNNYIKDFSNVKMNKKNILSSTKKVPSINQRDHNKTVQNQFKIALSLQNQTKQVRRYESSIRHDNILKKTKNNSKSDLQRKQLTLSHQPLSSILKTQINSCLYSSPLKNNHLPIQLEGIKCQYRLENKSKKQQHFNKKFRQQKDKDKFHSDSRIFLIEAWKAEKILGQNSFYDKNTLFLDDL